MAWILRVFFINIMLGKKDPALLATRANLAMLDDPVFVMLARSLMGLPPLMSGIVEAEAEKVGVVYRQGLLFLATLMLPFALLFINAQTLFRYLDHPEETIAASREYFLWMLLSYAMNGVFRLQARVLIARGDTTSPLIADIVESITNLSALYFFLNFFEWGNNAYPRAHVFASLISFLGYGAFFYCSSHLKKYKFLNLDSRLFVKKIYLQVISNGFFYGASGVLEQYASSKTTSQCALSANHNATLIADSTAKTYGALVSLLYTPNGTITSRDIPKYKDNPALCRILGNANFLANIMYASAALILLIPARNYFVSCFNDKTDQEATQIAMYFTFIRAFREIGNSARNAGTSILLGYSDTSYALFVNLFSIFVLNSALISATADQSVTSMYAMQIPCYFLATAAITNRWIHYENLEASFFQRQVGKIAVFCNKMLRNTSSLLCFWNKKHPSSDIMKTESPRHAEVEITLH